MSVKIRNLFNFFTKIGTEGHQAFYETWKHTADVVGKSPHFMRTQLHKNVDQTEKYKYYNYAQFDTDQTEVFKPELASPEWIVEMTKYMKSGKLAFPGGFYEIATYDGNPISPSFQQADSSVFITSGYTVAENVDTAELEASWKEWSGADIMQSTSSIGFHNAGLYKQFTEGRNPFSYVVRAEITKPGEDLKEALKLLEKVKSLKLRDGITADISLFQILPEGAFGRI